MKVLVVGGGGREHALAWKLAQSPTVDRLFVAPGNAGMAELGTCERISAGDVPGIVDFALREEIDLTVVGPEVPLVAGLADELEVRSRAVFGPTREAARIEGSKAWAKKLCERHGIPTPRSRSFTDFDEAVSFLDEMRPPFVVKADGLAAGKGVTVTDDREVAVGTLKAAILERAFGAAGARVLVEEHVAGREVTALALTDGTTLAPLPPAQDYKRAFDWDEGPNTGGMGAYSPVPFLDDETLSFIRRDILERTIAALSDEGVPYRGALYAGLMLTEDGPVVLEFNCRFGDPETQAILPRLKSDLGEVLLACAQGRLDRTALEWSPEACITVVLASGGYPGEHRTGFAVEGLEEARSVRGISLFHAGTRASDGRVLTAGGRVLSVSATGTTLEDARERAYEACGRISFEGMHYRRDIAAGVEARAGG
jgi:phosphoribosylamine---glycine ligase